MMSQIQILNRKGGVGNLIHVKGDLTGCLIGDEWTPMNLILIDFLLF